MLEESGRPVKKKKEKKEEKEKKAFEKKREIEKREVMTKSKGKISNREEKDGKKNERIKVL